MTAVTATIHLLSSGRPAGRLLAALRQMAHDLANPYHPERHYMRGPGPAWCRKHGVALAPVTVRKP